MGIYLRARFIFAYKKPPVTAAHFSLLSFG